MCMRQLVTLLVMLPVVLLVASYWALVSLPVTSCWVPVTLLVSCTYVFDYCAMKLLRPWKLCKLYWSESAVDVKYCCYELCLCCSCQAYLDLCDQLVVQEILPVLFLRLAIADPFKTKQESQDALEIPDKPPCYILQCSLLVLFSQ